MKKLLMIALLLSSCSTTLKVGDCLAPSVKSMEAMGVNEEDAKQLLKVVKFEIVEIKDGSYIVNMSNISDIKGIYKAYDKERTDKELKDGIIVKVECPKF